MAWDGRCPEMVVYCHFEALKGRVGLNKLRKSVPHVEGQSSKGELGFWEFHNKGVTWNLEGLGEKYRD